MAGVKSKGANRVELRLMRRSRRRRFIQDSAGVSIVEAVDDGAVVFSGGGD